MFSSKVPCYDRIYFPKRPPHETNGDYFLSKKCTTLLNSEGKIHNDEMMLDGSVRAQSYLTQKELRIAENKLKDRRDLYRKEKARMNKQWKELEKNEVGLRESFKRFDQFVKDNSNKRERAQIKTKEHTRLAYERKEQINKMNAECQMMRELKKKMDRSNAEHIVYEKFLNAVVDAESSFMGIKNIIERYSTLMDAKKELNVIRQDMLEQLDHAKYNMQINIKRFHDKINELLIKLIDLEAAYLKASEKCKKWENIYSTIKTEALEKTIKDIDIKQACLKMYLEICQRKKILPKYINNYEKQFITIKNAIGEYEALNKMVVENKNKELRFSIKPQLSSARSSDS